MRLFFILFLFALLPQNFAQSDYIKPRQIESKHLSKSFVLKDETNLLTIDELLANENNFSDQVDDLNFGMSWSTYWVKFELENNTNKRIDYNLAFESITTDTIVLYQTSKSQLLSKTLIGEGINYNSRPIKNLKPVLQLSLNPKQKYTYYLSGKSAGQPINLSYKILTNEHFENWNYSESFFIGAVYGIIFIILLLNLSFFITTKEKLYINFSLQVLCSWLCLIYFDGYITKYIFPNDLYWSNQSIAIAMSFTFVFSNLSVAEYFNLSKLAPAENKGTKYLTLFILLLLSISFLHPFGFFTYICCMIFATSLVAALLFKSILLVKKRGFITYFYGLIATINLIVFGSTFQLYIAGILPEMFITNNSMHLAVIGQALFMALAVNDKFKHIKEENNKYQERLVLALNEYAQNLTSNIESERQRLANDLHDSLGQNLLSIRNRILLIKKRKQISTDVDNELDTLSLAISGTLEEVRNISYNLRPPILNTLGLTAAINSLVENIQFTNDLEVNLDFPKPIDGLIHKDQEINVYRILQECFNNVIKHAEAKKVNLSIIVSNNIFFNFSDDGNGFNTDSIKKGQGLLGIKERVALLGGQVAINSTYTLGTEVTFSIPIINQ